MMEMAKDLYREEDKVGFMNLGGSFVVVGNT